MTMSLAGNLMIASTTVPQSVFSRGVCLIVHHDANGAIGVMLNRPIQPPPPELIGMLIGASVDLTEADDNAGADDRDATGFDVTRADATRADATDNPADAHGESLVGENGDDSPASCGAKNGNKKVGRSRLPAADSAGPTPALSNGGSAMIIGGGGGALSDPSGTGAGNAIVHFGGPVSGPVVAVHGSPDFAEAQAGEGVYVAAQKAHLKKK
jgi:hypothetical protein